MGGCGRGFHLPWITSKPISSPLTPPAWESILKLGGNPSVGRLLTNPSAFFRGRVAFRPRYRGVPALWTESTFAAADPILSPFGQEFPLSIKIKSFTQFLQVQRRNFTPRLILEKDELNTHSKGAKPKHSRNPNLWGRRWRRIFKKYRLWTKWHLVWPQSFGIASPKLIL